MQIFFRTLIALLLLIIFASPVLCQERLVIDGTGDSQQLLRDLGKAFEALNPGVQIVVPDSIGSGGGVKALIRGDCTIARVARALKESEKALAPDMTYHDFAYSPVVFTAVQADKCIDNLSTQQAVGVFSGAVSDWSELGNCPPGKIYVAMREAGDSSLLVLKDNIPDFMAISKFAGKVFYTTPEAAQAIEDHPNTIGFLPMALVSPKMTPFSFNSIAPIEENIQDGSYPLIAPFGLVWRGELTGLAARFINFVYSPAGGKIIRDSKVVPVPRQK